MCYDDQVSIQDGALPPHDGLKTAGYKDIISILKGAARPVTLQFEMGELPPELMSADQAKRALQLHIATQGGSNVEKITRLRRASMAQGSRAGGAAGRVASAASSPVASPRAGGGATTVTLGRPGPLGIKFQQAVDGSTVIGHVNDGSQVDLMRSWPPTSTQTQRCLTTVVAMVGADRRRAARCPCSLSALIGNCWPSGRGIWEAQAQAPADEQCAVTLSCAMRARQ